MKHMIKRMLALLIAILLAMPTVSFAEMPVEVPVIDDTIFEGEALDELEIDPAMDEASAAQLALSEDLSGDLLTEDAPQSEAAAMVTYCFIVDNVPVATQEARESDEIIRPADPKAPADLVFVGWFLEDGSRLFADTDGDGLDDPIIAHPDGLITQVNVYARFAEAEATEPPTGSVTPVDEPASPEGETLEEPTEGKTEEAAGEPTDGKIEEPAGEPTVE